MLSSSLLVGVRWGLLSAQELQTFAHAMFKDGLTIPDIRSLASLDQWGESRGHAHRDLVRRLSTKTST